MDIIKPQNVHQFNTHRNTSKLLFFVQKYILITHTIIIMTDYFQCHFRNIIGPKVIYLGKLTNIFFFLSLQTDECQKSLKQFPMMVDEQLIQSLPLDGATQPYIIIIALVLSLVVIMLVGMLGWVFYAYRNPTTRSGQILIRSTAKSRLFRSPSTSTV